MKINTQELQPNYVLNQDVFINTTTPIVKKGILLTEKEIDVLKAFLVKEVDVNMQESLINPKQLAFQSNLEDLFKDAVDSYKNMFNTWECGLSIDILAIRKKYVPFIEEIIENEEECIKLFGLSNIKEEDHIYCHAIYMCMLSALLTKKLDYTKGDIIQVAMGALLSNCGLARIHFNKMKSIFYIENTKEYIMHPATSYQLVKNLSFLRTDIKISILQHHECLNGKGYPLGLRDNKLEQHSTLLGIVDNYAKILLVEGKGPTYTLQSILKNSFGSYRLDYIQLLIKVLNYQ